jgi:hypothetical protein
MLMTPSTSAQRGDAFAVMEAADVHAAGSAHDAVAMQQYNGNKRHRSDASFEHSVLPSDADVFAAEGMTTQAAAEPGHAVARHAPLAGIAHHEAGPEAFSSRFNAAESSVHPLSNSILGSTQAQSVYMKVSNIHSDVTHEELRQRMSEYVGCCSHTLQCRPSPTVANTIEFLVEFSSKEHADRCALDLSGLPFSTNHPELGAAIARVKPISNLPKTIEQTGRMTSVQPLPPTYSSPQPPVRLVASASSAPSRTISRQSRSAPSITPETFDIGDRPVADVRRCFVS